MEQSHYNPDHVFRLHPSSLIELRGGESYINYGKGEFPFSALKQLWFKHASIDWELNVPTADQQPLRLAEATLCIPRDPSLQIPAGPHVRDLRKKLKTCLDSNICEEEHLQRSINISIWDLLNKPEIQKIVQDLAEIEQREVLEIFKGLQNSLPSLILNIVTLLSEIQAPILLSQYPEFSKRIGAYVESDLEEQDPKIMGYMKRRLAATRKKIKIRKEKRVIERSIYMDFLETYNKAYYREDIKALEEKRRANIVSLMLDQS